MRALIGLGSNLDDPAVQVRQGLRALAQIPQSRLLRQSRLYRSEPWGLREQPAFVNAVAELETTLGAGALLDALLAIEHARGRRRDGLRWGPRRIDLDLLVYGSERIETPGLRVPHPELAARAFVLVPLAEIDRELEIPGLGRVADLLALVDTGGCVALSAA